MGKKRMSFIKKVKVDVKVTVGKNIRIKHREGCIEFPLTYILSVNVL